MKTASVLLVCAITLCSDFGIAAGDTSVRNSIKAQIDEFKERVKEADAAAASTQGQAYRQTVQNVMDRMFWSNCMKYGMPRGSVTLVAYINQGGAATYADAYPKTKVAECPLEILNSVQFPRPPTGTSEPGYPVSAYFDVN
jgi:hypothetical protein